MLRMRMLQVQRLEFRQCLLAMTKFICSLIIEITTKQDFQVIVSPITTKEVELLMNLGYLIPLDCDDVCVWEV